MHRFITVSSLLMLTACASIVEGTHQDITINTNPPGAECALVREGKQIAQVNKTPGSVNIKKTKHDITVICNREGYQQTTYLNHSGAAGATFGNIVLGGGIGWAVDSARGADNKYDSPVNMTLLPVTIAQAPETNTISPAGSPLPPEAIAAETPALPAPILNAPAVDQPAPVAGSSDPMARYLKTADPAAAR